MRHTPEDIQGEETKPNKSREFGNKEGNQAVEYQGSIERGEETWAQERRQNNDNDNIFKNKN